MNHQNQMNYQPSSSSNPFDYFDNYNNNNNINNPQIDQIPSAPPDPSYFYYSSPPENNGVQKFRVVLLSEGASLQGDMDVLCQIGLDGIRILDPATSRMLKVYTLDTVTRWEVLDSNVFAFWTKSSMDTNERRVRLKSNSYTTTNILDLVAAASIQFKEMDGLANSEQVAEKKKVFPDWKNLMKPGNEEKDHWISLIS